MNQFFNSRETLVENAIDGLLRASGGALARLDGYPHIRVVIRADWDRTRVALVSGGGSGHEPSHAGFVGQGMLTAAICGDVFASPSVDAVLAAILAVTGESGCLLIVKNYTGDRLNFGLATERARALGLDVRMVIVSDDIALPDLPQPRGLAGTLFVHKIAGSLAEAGANLDTVSAAASNVIGRIVSLGMSLGTCSVPGMPKQERIGKDKAEIGLGIHGEPGAEQVDYANATQSMGMVADRLARTLGAGPHVALLNNLGGAMPLEMALLSEELVGSPIGDRIHWMIGPAPMMTSLDMHGFSVSLLPLEPGDLDALLAPAAPRAWPGAWRVGDLTVLPLPDDLLPAQPTPSRDERMAALLTQCCEALVSAEHALNTLDTASGDGDTGTTLATAARFVVGRIDQLPLADLPGLFRAVGINLSQSIGGSSGVLLAIFFAAAGEACMSGEAPVRCLQAGLTRIGEVGGAKRGDRTLIDALGPALDALPEGLHAAATAARKGADLTATMTKARAGRASYVSANALAGHKDPGAEAVALVFERMAEQ